VSELPRKEIDVSPRFRLHLSALVLTGLLFAACDGDGRSPTAPVANVETVLYEAEADLTSWSVDAECEWGTPDPALHGVEWRMERIGDSIRLIKGDELDETRFTGTLAGDRFVGKITGRDPARSCELREAWIDVTFATDFSSFRADEAWYYGPPGDEEVVAWRWTAQAL
jgi:hypothetical protein